PGFSADYTARQNWMMPTDLEMSDWVPTDAAKALIQNNRPLLAFIGGKPGAPTSKDHNFLPGERVEKQLILINNARATVRCVYAWRLDLDKRSVDGNKNERILRTGEQER